MIETSNTEAALGHLRHRLIETIHPQTLWCRATLRVQVAFHEYEVFQAHPTPNPDADSIGWVLQPDRVAFIAPSSASGSGRHSSHPGCIRTVP